MVEGKVEKSFEERVVAYMERLSQSKLVVLYGIANTVPGGPCDAPFAPIDPALYAAARRLVEEYGLSEDASLFGVRSGMVGI